MKKEVLSVAEEKHIQTMEDFVFETIQGRGKCHNIFQV